MTALQVAKLLERLDRIREYRVSFTATQEALLATIEGSGASVQVVARFSPCCPPKVLLRVEGSGVGVLDLYRAVRDALEGYECDVVVGGSYE